MDCRGFSGWILNDEIRDKIADRMGVISVYMVTTDKKIRSRKNLLLLTFLLACNFWWKSGGTDVIFHLLSSTKNPYKH